jgi:hypothetical protein
MISLLINIWQFWNDVKIFDFNKHPKIMDTKRENLYQKIKPECLSIRALIF